jgi:glycosyltransferase involved in cell wall biosynthesis
VSDAVDFPGFVQNPVSYFAKSDLVVMSSHYEALPTVLIEAMACGTPVVSTDCPTGPREIMLDGKFGGLVPVNEPSALADAIIQTLENPIDATSLIERAKDFSVEAAAKRYVQLAEDILKN